MRNAGLEEAEAGIKIAGRNINNLRYADDTTLMAESEEELQKVKDYEEDYVSVLHELGNGASLKQMLLPDQRFS